MTAAGGPDRPFTFAEVLWDELKHLKRREGEEPAPGLKEIYGRIGALGAGEKALSALCLSGGGIRSATFNLGVIQALAGRGLLAGFDYLSSVSGGGYIAGWLRKWLHVVPPAKLAEALSRPADAAGFNPLAPEPGPVDHLREFSNYLTPRLGLFSPDTWAAAALVVRNLILNWLVLVPVLAALVAVPQAGLIVAGASPARGNALTEPWGLSALYAAAVLAAAASAAIYHLRRERTRPPTEPRILAFGIAPLWLSCLALSLAGLWLPQSAYGDRGLGLFCLLWCVFIPLLGWALAFVSARGQAGAPPWKADLAGIVLSGAVAGALLFSIARSWLPALADQPPLFVVFAVPILLGLYLLARALFVAFASLGEGGQPSPSGAVPASELGYADREWWARLSGWVLLLAVAWMAASFLVDLGGYLVDRYLGTAVAAMGGISGLVTALLGASPQTPAKCEGERTPPSPFKEWALRLLAPVSVVFLVLLLAQLTAWLARLTTGVAGLLAVSGPATRLDLGGKGLLEVLLRFGAVPLGLTLLSGLLGRVVNVNRFSAHGLYRNRLIRAYLGASNPSRRPDPFTGFDPRDNLALHELGGGASPRPLPVVNATLNLVRGRRLAWQQRKAESFSMTPLYCGNFHEGYRRSSEYGGRNGISLGTAVTISGAAANPSAGYHSSPLVGFLMTLFNVRLGCWLGNPNQRGAKVYRRSGPRHAWMPLFADLLGLTDAQHAYVSLSDGGHFENLGAYEMVLRRCRLIVVSDAGQDGGHDFEDLGNLIRKVRIDFGVPIRFEKPICILPRASAGPGLLCALAIIDYDEVDRGTPKGLLLYLKPTLRAAGAPLRYDVFSYARGAGQFPHEPTADQWFSEAQFESYRALGQHLASQLGGGRAFEDLPSFFDTVRRELETAEAGAECPKAPIV